MVCLELPVGPASYSTPTDVALKESMSEYAVSWSQTITPSELLCQLPPSLKEDRTTSCFRLSQVDGPAKRSRLYAPPLSVALIRTVDAWTVGVMRSGS